MLKTLFFLLFLNLSLYAQIAYGLDLVKYNKNNISNPTEVYTPDIYNFSYDSKSNKCIMKKNNLVIPSFDERFKKKEPKVRSYRCPSWIKEQYYSCKIIDRKSVSSLALSFGRFQRTNFLIAFNPNYKGANAHLTIECRK